jgi:isopenicillin-N N-acyltransferase-like protein
MSDGFRYRLVDVSGDPERRGHAYGRAAAPEIAHNAMHYRGHLARSRGAGPDELARSMQRVAEVMADGYADALVEVDAIAAGAGLAREDVLLVNARSEALQALGAECTTAAVLPERSADGHTLLAQNWDWLCGSAGGVVLLRSTDEHGTTMVSLHEAGMLARGGFNSHGVGVVGNFLASPTDRSRLGVPLPVSGQRMLRAAGLAAVLDVIHEGRRTISTNYLVASAEGLAVDVETTPDTQHPLLPEGGLLVHANHYRTPGIVDIGVRTTTDSLYRDWRLHQLLDAHELVGRSELQEALADTRGAPRSISRLPSGDPPDSTLASMVMDLDARELWVSDGPPSQRPYHHLRLDQDDWGLS